MTERDVERALRLMVERCGGLCLKWICPGWSGVPDRILLLPGGRAMFVEVKRPTGGRLSGLQRWWLDRLRKMEFEVHVVRNRADVDRLRAALMEKGGRGDEIRSLSASAGGNQLDT